MTESDYLLFSQRKSKIWRSSSRSWEERRSSSLPQKRSQSRRARRTTLPSWSYALLATCSLTRLTTSKRPKKSCRVSHQLSRKTILTPTKSESAEPSMTRCQLNLEVAVGSRGYEPKLNNALDNSEPMALPRWGWFIKGQVRGSNHGLKFSLWLDLQHLVQALGLIQSNLLLTIANSSNRLVK